MSPDNIQTFRKEYIIFFDKENIALLLSKSHLYSLIYLPRDPILIYIREQIYWSGLPLTSLFSESAFNDPETGNILYNKLYPKLSEYFGVATIINDLGSHFNTLNDDFQFTELISNLINNEFVNPDINISLTLRIIFTKNTKL